VDFELEAQPSTPAAYQVGAQKAPDLVQQWCDDWNLAAKSQNVNARLRSYTKVRPNGMNSTLQLILDAPGHHVKHSLRTNATRELCKDATLSLIMSVGLPKVACD
jgi:hypothetical protein